MLLPHQQNRNISQKPRETVCKQTISNQSNFVWQFTLDMLLCSPLPPPSVDPYRTCILMLLECHVLIKKSLIQVDETRPYSSQMAEN